MHIKGKYVAYCILKKKQKKQYNKKYSTGNKDIDFNEPLRNVYIILNFNQYPYLILL